MTILFALRFKAYRAPTPVWAMRYVVLIEFKLNRVTGVTSSLRNTSNLTGYAFKIALV